MLARAITGHVTVESRQPGQISRYRTGLMNLLDGTRPNFLYIAKKYFRVPMKILNTKIRSWSLPQLLFIIITITIISFVQGIYTYIPETNNVPREYIVAAIVLSLFMVPISHSSCVGSSVLLC
jgi:hypothetical protein